MCNEAGVVTFDNELDENLAFIFASDMLLLNIGAAGSKRNVNCTHTSKTQTRCSMLLLGTQKFRILLGTMQAAAAATHLQDLQHDVQV